MLSSHLTQSLLYYILRDERTTLRSNITRSRSGTSGAWEMRVRRLLYRVTCAGAWRHGIRSIDRRRTRDRSPTRVNNISCVYNPRISINRYQKWSLCTEQCYTDLYMNNCCLMVVGEPLMFAKCNVAYGQIKHIKSTLKSIQHICGTYKNC